MVTHASSLEQKTKNSSPNSSQQLPRNPAQQSRRSRVGTQNNRRRTRRIRSGPRPRRTGSVRSPETVSDQWSTRRRGRHAHRRNQAHARRRPARFRGELHLRDSDGVARVGNCGARGLRGLTAGLAGRGRGHWGGRDSGNSRRGRGGRDESDSGRDSGDDARVLGDVGAADAGEVGEGGLDLFFGGAPGADARDDSFGELGRRAEAAGVAVGVAFRHEREPRVDAFRD
jgi:hypothetical protein